jgi:phosphotransferase system HPr (HPr) family protein
MPASSNRTERADHVEQAITLTGDLHARPAGALAVAAARFTSAVSVTAGARTVDAKSVLSVMGLGATSGQKVTVTAAGPDAREAVATLIAILAEATRVSGLRRRAVYAGRGNLRQREPDPRVFRLRSASSTR